MEDQFCIASTRRHDFNKSKTFGPEKIIRILKTSFVGFPVVIMAVILVIHVIVGDRTLTGWKITIINSPACKLSYLLFMLGK